MQALGGGQRLGQHGPQPRVVVLGEARFQGELQAGERGAQLVGGVGGEVAFVAQEFGETVQHLVVRAGDLVDLGDAARSGPCGQVVLGHRPAVAGEFLQRRGQRAGLPAGDEDGDGQRERGDAEQQRPGGDDPVAYGGCGG